MRVTVLFTAAVQLARSLLYPPKLLMEVDMDAAALVALQGPRPAAFKRVVRALSLSVAAHVPHDERASMTGTAAGAGPLQLHRTRRILSPALRPHACMHMGGTHNRVLKHHAIHDDTNGLPAIILHDRDTELCYYE